MKKAKQITTKERERLNTLIEIVLKKYSIDDIVFSFLDKTDGWKDRSDIVTALLKDESLKDDLKEELEAEINEGKTIIKLQTMDQESKLKDFLCTSIFPYYNQQQAFLFS